MNRVTHNKKLKNNFKFYKNSFNLHPPYLILCDPNFLFASVDTKTNIKDRFTEICKGQIYLKITRCGIKELETLKGNNINDTFNYIEKNLQIFKCSHKTCSPSDCILENLEKGFNGIIDTQDHKLINLIQKKYFKIPIFFLKNGLQIINPSKDLKNKIKLDLESKYSIKPNIEIPKIELNTLININEFKDEEVNINIIEEEKIPKIGRAHV